MLRASLSAGVVAVVAALAWLARGETAPPQRAEARTVAARPAPPPASTPAPLADPATPDAPTAQPAVRVDPRFFTPDPAAFPPLPTPGPTDWLSQHPEDGQTFEEFRTCRRRSVTDERKTIGLLALDDLSRVGVSTATLAEFVGLYYGLPAKAVTAGAHPAFATRKNPNTRNDQTYTKDVLRWLTEQVPLDVYCLVALTTEDLYPDPAWNFVFGEATFFSRVGVFSFARMDPGFPSPILPVDRRRPDERLLVLRRCLKVVAHEVGHMFGMEHCTQSACGMNGSNSVVEMDRQPPHLCPVCLRKMQHAVGFDPADRYRRLESFYRREGLVAEADWAAGRLAATTAR